MLFTDWRVGEENQIVREGHGTNSLSIVGGATFLWKSAKELIYNKVEYYRDSGSPCLTPRGTLIGSDDQSGPDSFVVLLAYRFLR